MQEKISKLESRIKIKEDKLAKKYAKIESMKVDCKKLESQKFKFEKKLSKLTRRGTDAAQQATAEDQGAIAPTAVFQ